MSTIFIFHGIEGHPGENWFPWLRERLEARGHRVIIPAFPHAETPDLQEWTHHFRAYASLVDDETVFIGHSLGAAFALRLLERLDRPINATFLVAPVWGFMGNAFDARMATFTEQPFDWPAIRKSGGRCVVLYSDNDPYIRETSSKDLADLFGGGSVLVSGAGHFNAKAGYTTFPILLERIEETCH